MKNIVKLTAFCLLISSCNDKKSMIQFENTVWKYELAEDCISSLKFKKNQKYIYYNCERQDTCIGRYEYKNDTLFLDEFGCYKDRDIKNVLQKNTIKVNFKLILKNGKLRHIERIAFLNSEWQVSDREFPTDFFLRK
jgi:hypothetical protein